MKTIITEKIDGYKVILRICDALGFIDPEKTKAKVIAEIAKTDVAKKIEALKNQMLTIAVQAETSKRALKSAQNKPEQSKFWREYQQRLLEMKDTEEKLKPLAVEFKNKYSELTLELAEYFSLPPHEEYVSDQESDEFATLMADGQLVTRDKKKIADQRGLVFWKKTGGTWARTDVVRLGEKIPGGAIEGGKLSEAQRTEIMAQLDMERIGRLSAQGKSIEKSSVISILVTRAGAMKNELEVLADPQALKKSQEWLADEKLKVEARYA